MDRAPSTPRSTIDEAGKSAAILSATEVGLGSVLHAFEVPLAGHFLSLNQGFILSRAALRTSGLKSSRTVAAHISNTSALLKSLSPAGKKLTPMLAISAQGLLFSAGTLALGANRAGVLLGSVVSSLWSIAQPVLVYALLFGKPLVLAIRHAGADKWIWPIIAAFIALKALAAAALAVLAWRLPEAKIDAIQRKLILHAGAARRQRLAELERDGSVPTRGQLIRSSLRDLVHPLFLASLAVTAAFFYFSHASASQAIWGMLRPIAIGFLCFFAVRLLPFERWSAGSPTLQTAIKSIKDL